MTAGAAVLVALIVALVIALLVSQGRTRGELRRSREVQDELMTRVALLEHPTLTRAPASAVEFVITGVGDPEPPVGPAVAGRIEGRLFADIVARETVVKAASWTHGVRHALSAENRNRIRFEMRRETKRSARQRRSDVKEALRQYYSRGPGDVA